MEIEADLYLIFTGWDARTTAEMSIEELTQWHEVALRRRNQSGG
ncbi:MAG: GpE family phage tail protein [Aeromonas sp.]